MSLLDLPNEILSQCCSTQDAKALRLTCKRLALFSAQQVFANIHLRPTALSAKKALSILENEHLSPLVTGITLQTYLCDEEERRYGLDTVPCWNIETSEVGTDPPPIEHPTSMRPYGHEFDKRHEKVMIPNHPNSLYPGFYQVTGEQASLLDVGHGGEEERELSNIFKRLLRKLGLFINLRRLELLHSAIVRESRH